MSKKKELSSQEVKAIKEIKNKYHDGVDTLLEDYRESKAKVKISNKKTDVDRIMDMFIDGDCPDTIRRALNMERAEVEKILVDYGAM
tara:strand:+ start:476 stop:736 length:261 start_codon:yes stop_codon:yes gene_type:complete